MSRRIRCLPEVLYLAIFTLHAVVGGKEITTSRRVDEAADALREAQQHAEVEMLAAREAAAQLRGKEHDVSLMELHRIAEERLISWLGWVASRDFAKDGASTAAVSQAFSILPSSFQS